MNLRTPIDLDAVTRDDPYAPRRLTEYALDRLEADVAAARARSGDVLTKSAQELEQFYVELGTLQEARAAIVRAQLKQLSLILPLTEPDYFGDPNEIDAPLDALSDEIKSLRGLGSVVADYHAARSDHYNQIAAHLGQLIAIVPGVRREVWRSKVLASLVRASGLLVALGATVFLESRFGPPLDALFGHLLPDYTKAIVVIVLYLTVLIAVERPLEWLIDTVNWRRFEHMRAARSKHLTQIRQTEAKLNALTPPAPGAGS